jgi:hypothetical protein
MKAAVSVLLGHSKRAGSNVTRGYIMKNDATLLAATDKVSIYIWQAMTGDGLSPSTRGHKCVVCG